MSWWMLISLLISVAAVSMTGPGLFLLQPLRWPIHYRLPAAVALSLFWTYLASLLIRTLAPGLFWHQVLLVLNIALAVLAWRQYRLIWRRRLSRRLILIYLLVLGWSLLHLLATRYYSGGLWAGDYYEHYERLQWFEGKFELDHLFVGMYPLPARPPLMNAAAAHWLILVGDLYELYQLAALFLSALAAPACLLIAPALAAPGRSRRRVPLLLLPLLVLSPMLLQNQVYPWTKALTAFYVISGLALYLAALRKNELSYLVGAFAVLCAGMLVHYSAGPYLVAIGLHYLLFELRRRLQPVGELIYLTLFSTAILGSWIFWSIHHFGPSATFSAHVTSAPGAGECRTIPQHLFRVLKNLCDTLIPHPFRRLPPDRLIQPSRLGTLRDYFFQMYQTNLLVALGLAGALLVPALLYLRLLRPTLLRLYQRLEPLIPPNTTSANSLPQPAPSLFPPAFYRRFWLFILPLIVLLGQALVVERDPWGTAHLCLQPLIYLGLTFLAGNLLTLPLWTRWLLLLGCLADLILGIFLHTYLRSLPLRVIPLAEKRVRIQGTELLNEIAIAHASAKQFGGLWFLADHFPRLLWLPQYLAAMFAAAVLILLFRTLELRWPRRLQL